MLGTILRPLASRLSGLVTGAGKGEINPAAVDVGGGADGPDRIAHTVFMTVHLVLELKVAVKLIGASGQLLHPDHALNRVGKLHKETV